MYVGEFHYGKTVIPLPDLAILHPEVFEAAQKRRAKSKAAAVTERRYQFLLAGHLRCSCTCGMSGDPMASGKYLYYACNQELNKRHMKQCFERRIRADAADPLVWDWLVGLLLDPAKLEKGLRELEERTDAELAPKRQRLAVLEDLVREVELRIKKLAGVLGDETDDFIAGALKAEMKQAGRERVALMTERDTLRTDLTQGKMTAEERQEVIALALQIQRRLQAPTFDQKRSLLNALDVQVKLGWKDDQRGLWATCALTLKPPQLSPRPNGAPASNGEWLTLPLIGRKYTSTTTTSHPSSSWWR